MREAGANYVRMRLWVDPPPGYSDLASDLALARQVSAAGMKIYLDIMYSDFWADPTKQNIPAAWAGEDLGQLTATVRSYTRQVISAFAQQGTPVDLVSIGNEIRNGILWPAGEINCTGCGGWASLAQLLKAGVAGAQAGNPAGHKLLIMMHYDQGGSFALSSAFYSQLESYGVPFDVIGLSYYPVLDEPSISGLRANVDGLATEFGKPIVIAETQYPWTLANGNSPLGDSTGDFAWEQSQLEPGYPATPGGQLSFVTDELSILATAPGRARGGAVLLGAGLDPGRAVGAGRRHRLAQRQHDPVQLRRARRCRRSASSRTRPGCASAPTPTALPAWWAADTPPAEDPNHHLERARLTLASPRLPASWGRGQPGPDVASAEDQDLGGLGAVLDVVGGVAELHVLVAGAGRERDGDGVAGGRVPGVGGGGDERGEARCRWWSRGRTGSGFGCSTRWRAAGRR